MSGVATSDVQRTMPEELGSYPLGRLRSDLRSAVPKVLQNGVRRLDRGYPIKHVLSRQS
jgi:hypothetical protein